MNVTRSKRPLFFSLTIGALILLFTNATDNQFKIANFKDIATQSAVVTKISEEYIALNRFDLDSTNWKDIRKDFEAWSKISNGSQAITDFKKYMINLEKRINENSSTLGITAKLSTDGYEISLTGSDQTPLGQTIQNIKTVTKLDPKINVFSQIDENGTMGYVDPSIKKSFFISQDIFVNSTATSDELVGLVVHEGIIHGFLNLVKGLRHTVYSGWVMDARSEIIGEQLKYNNGFRIDEVRAWYEDSVRININYTKESNYQKVLDRVEAIANEIKTFKGLINGVEWSIGDFLDLDNVKFSKVNDSNGRVQKNLIEARSPHDIGVFHLQLYGAEKLNLNDKVVKDSLKNELKSTLADLWGNVRAMSYNIDLKQQRAISGFEQAFNRLVPNKTFPREQVENIFRPLTDLQEKDLRDTGDGPKVFGRLKEQGFQREAYAASQYYKEAFKLNNQKGLGANQVSKITAGREQVNVFGLSMFPRTIRDGFGEAYSAEKALANQPATQKMLVCDPGSEWAKVLNEVKDRTKYKTAKEVLEKLQSEFDKLLSDVDLKKTGVLLTDGRNVVSIKKIALKVGDESNEYYVDDSVPVADKLYSQSANENIKSVVNAEVNTAATALVNKDIFSAKVAGGDLMETKDFSAVKTVNTSETDISKVIVPTGTVEFTDLNSSINVKIIDQSNSAQQGNVFVAVVPPIPSTFKGEVAIVEYFNQVSNSNYVNNLVNLPVINSSESQYAVDPFSAIANNYRMVPECDYCVDGPSAVELAKTLGIDLKW